MFINSIQCYHLTIDFHKNKISTFATFLILLAFTAINIKSKKTKNMNPSNTIYYENYN